MGKPIEISREESSAAELRALASSTRDGRVVRRLLAIAMVLEGQSRVEAAQLNGMDRQSLRDWVHRYNDEGIARLHPRAIPGRPGALTDEQNRGWQSPQRRRGRTRAESLDASLALRFRGERSTHVSASSGPAPS